LMQNEDDQIMEHEVDDEDVLTQMESRFQEFQEMVRSSGGLRAKNMY
jgi:hypothetical protein